MTDLVSDSSAPYRMFLQAWWPDLTADRRAAPAGRRRASLARRRRRHPRRRRAGGPRRQLRRGRLVGGRHRAAGRAGADARPDRGRRTPTRCCSSARRRRTTEVITTADRLRDVREVDPDAEPHDTFAHVLVDEAQDITPMQWRMLRRRGSQASWTIVGDPAQSSWPDLEESAQAQQELIGSAPHRQFRLSHQLPQPRGGVRVRRRGRPPRLPGGRPARRRPLDRGGAAAAGGPRGRSSSPSWIGRWPRSPSSVQGTDRRDRSPRPGWKRSRQRGVGRDRGRRRARRVPEPAATPRAWSTTR